MHSIVKDVNGLVHSMLEEFANKVVGVMPVAEDAVRLVLSSYKNIFDELNSEYLFRKYLKMNFKFVVSFQTVWKGTYIIYKLATTIGAKRSSFGASMGGSRAGEEKEEEESKWLFCLCSNVGDNATASRKWNYPPTGMLN